MKRIAALVVSVCAIFVLSAPVAAGNFAAAASLAPPMEIFVREFNAQGGAIKAVFGASGNLARQIEAGAPYELFFSANEDWARYLEKKGFLSDVRAFVSCPLVLWHDKKTPPALDALKKTALRVAIANPDTAPFGKLSVKYLEKEGLYKAMVSEKRLVVAGDILKAGMSCWSGGADYALVSLSVALKLGGSYTAIPTPPQTLYCGVVSARITDEAKKFMEYVNRPQSQKVWNDTGFEIIPK